jgi:ABC-type protease/lipase transport system fused ATPase/permease subunit
MASAPGPQPPDSAEKNLGEIVNEVSSKAQLLVREEIELAKAEVTQKVSRLAKGAGFFAGAGILAVFGLIWFFHFLAIGLADWFGLKVWVGYAIVTAFLFIVVGLLALLGVRSVKKGSPPTPQLAIEEAKKTRAVLEEARS